MCVCVLTRGVGTRFNVVDRFRLCVWLFGADCYCFLFNLIRFISFAVDMGHLYISLTMMWLCDDDLFVKQSNEPLPPPPTTTVALTKTNPTEYWKCLRSDLRCVTRKLIFISFLFPLWSKSLFVLFVSDTLYYYQEEEEKRKEQRREKQFKTESWMQKKTNKQTNKRE